MAHDETSLDVPAAGSGAAKGRVSVIVATYNYARFVGEAIESILAQDYPAFEVIVVDDASTDETGAVLKAFETRVTVLRHADNKGQAGCLNTGFAAASGEFVFFFDADDVMAPGALSAAVAAWKPGASRVAFQLGEVDADLRHMDRLAEEGDPVRCDPRRIRSFHDLRSGPPTSGNLYLRQALEAFFPMDEAAWPAYTDVYCNVMASLAGTLVTLERPLAHYRIHGNNLSLRGGYTLKRVRRLLPIEPNLRAALKTHGMREEAVPHLSPRYFKLRMASLLLDPEGHPHAGDTRMGLAWAGIKAARHCRFPAGLAVAIRFLGFALLPNAAARRLVRSGMEVKSRHRNRRK